MPNEINPSREIQKAHDKPRTSDSSLPKGETYSYGDGRAKHVARFPISETKREEARVAPEYPEGPSGYTEITAGHIIDAAGNIGGNLAEESITSIHKEVQGLLFYARNQQNNSIVKELQKWQKGTDSIKKKFADFLLKIAEDDDSQAT